MLKDAIVKYREKINGSELDYHSKKIKMNFHQKDLVNAEETLISQIKAEMKKEIKKISYPLQEYNAVLQAIDKME